MASSGNLVRVSPKGKITFQLRFRYDGKPARLDMGTYPALSLKDAREERDRMRGQLEKGYDPRIVRHTEKKAIIEAPTLEDVSPSGITAMYGTKLG